MCALASRLFIVLEYYENFLNKIKFNSSQWTQLLFGVLVLSYPGEPKYHCWKRISIQDAVYSSGCLNTNELFHVFLTFIPLWSQMFLDAVQQYYFADCLICSSVIKPPPVLVSCYFQYLWCQLMIFALFMFHIQAAQQVSAGVCCFIQLATTLNPLTSEINGTNKCKLRSEWFWQRSTCDGYNWVTSSKQQV